MICIPLTELNLLYRGDALISCEVALMLKIVLD
jgi:hypothetical protein